MRSARPRGPLVLLVDDNEDNLELYTQYLQFKGCRVAAAADGKSGIAQAQSLLPDAIVMDLSLPIVDGWAATATLKKDPKTKHIPVLALTGHALDSSKKRAVEAGADVYLTKPLLPEALFEAVGAILKKRGRSS
jgi:CheY-like chemotaxis protein